MRARGGRALTPDAYLVRLNDAQREAVVHFEGPLLVLAGAGSGKTRVLTTRIAHLIHHQGVPPDRILAVTFTNKAAGEMRDRIAGLLGEEPRGMWIGTFHALGARILRRHAPGLGWTNNFTIFDAEQSLRMVKKMAEATGLDTRRWSPKAIRARLSAAKNQLVSPRQFIKETEGAADIFSRQVARVYPVYQESLRNQNAFDFDDLLVQARRAVRSGPGPARSIPATLQFRSRRRVSGHESCPVSVRGTPRLGAPEPHGSGRRRPEHIRVEGS